jgi:probable F420-dependent oxidoreductase
MAIAGAPHVGVTFAGLMGGGPALAPRVAARADELGYSSFWTAETTGPEAFSILAAAGAAAPGIGLGTGVLALQLRTPMVVAMGGATLQALHPDAEVLLGVGISSPVVATQWHGVDWGDRPLGRVREYVALVKACLAGDVVTHQGDHYDVRRFRLGVTLGDRRPQVVIGALNERMLRLAGEVADGVLLNYVPASHVPWSVGQVRAGEAAGGRPAGDCTVYGYVHVGVGDRAAAREPARRDLFSYAVVDSYAANFRRAGFADEVDAIRAAHAERDRAGALAAVSDRFIDAIDIVGDAAHVAAAVAAYVRAGVDVPVVMPLPWGPDRWAVIDATLRGAIGA